MAYPPTAVDAVVEGLRGRILSGSLQPGTSLPPERELAGQLAVSRATLREGLSILSQMGLLAIHRGRAGGAVVTAPPATTVSASIALLFQTRSVTAGQLCEFRRALEVEAAQLAAVRRSRQELEEIVIALDAYVASSQDTAAQNLHGRAFHHAVARASGNPLLTETMASLNDAFAACFHLATHSTSARSGATHPRSALADPRCYPPAGRIGCPARDAGALRSAAKRSERSRHQRSGDQESDRGRSRRDDRQHWVSAAHTGVARGKGVRSAGRIIGSRASAVIAGVWRTS